MIRTVLLILCIGFTHNLYAKLSAAAVSKIHSEYLAANKVLFYIGKHKHSDKVAIWGQTELTEDMVRILLESPRDVRKMEELLRSSGTRWAGNYHNYHLYDFLLSEPEQTDRIFARAAKNSTELTLLNSYVDHIEEVDGVVKLFDKDGNAVLPVENGKVHECAMAEGDACHLLYRSFHNYSKGLVQTITPKEEKLLDYLEKNIQLLEGSGIPIADIVKELGFKSGFSLGRTIFVVKKKLQKNTGHFIHGIKSDTQLVDSEQITFYRFADTIISKEEEIIAYLEKNIQLLEGKGIVIADMAEELGFTHGVALGWAIIKLKKKLSGDPNHFIHRVEPENWWIDGKQITLYRFAGAIAPITPITPKEEEIIAYFEKNMQLLEQSGIVIANMAKELGFTHGVALGRAIIKLKKKLSGDPSHFIHKIRLERQQIDGKQDRFYRFADATTPITTITPKEKSIITYFEKNMQLLKQGSIIIADMAKKLGFSHGTSLGHAIRRLKKKLSGDPSHFIHKVRSEREQIDGKLNRFYRFADATTPITTITPKEKSIITYFEKNMQLLEQGSIVIADMAKKLGFSHGVALGHAIRRLKKKLSGDPSHFIHRIVYNTRRAITFYHLAP